MGEQHHPHRHIHKQMIASGTPFFWRLLLPFLAIGVLIYKADGQTWTVSFLNATMLLGGMGPVGDMHKGWTMILAGVYALVAGLVFVLISGAMLQPVMLEAIKRFHLDNKETTR
jgi:hypothetical protein